MNRPVFQIGNRQLAVGNPLARWLLPTAVCLLLFLAHVALAQSATATLSGTVVDQNGALVPGVAITVINPGTGLQWQATTNDDGYFVIPLLPPGAFTVRAQRDGFATIQANDIILNVGDQKSLKIQLKTGDLKETVVISGEAPLINESPAVGTTVDRQFAANIPLNGRSFQSLIALTPGVVIAKVPVGYAPGQFSVNGQRTDTNYFTVDGVSANFGINSNPSNGEGFAGAQPAFGATGGTNNLVSVEALQEFRIQTNSYAPEFGRSPGAQVQIVTRSGTNEFHGTLFEYFRNDALDANDWFANATKQRRAPLRQNDFGVVVGGPVLLPRFGEGGRQPGYNGKNRSFFFFSYEGLRLRQPQVAIKSVPSLATRNEAGAAVKPLLQAFPLPNGPDLINGVTGQPTGFAQFFAGYSNALTLNATSIRVDHSVSNKLSLFGRFNNAPSVNAARGDQARFPASLVSYSVADARTTTVGAMVIMNSALTDDLRINYSTADGSSDLALDTFGGAIVPGDSLLFPTFTSPSSGLAAVFLLYNGNNIAYFVGHSAGNFQRQLNVVNTLSAAYGTHQLKFGADYRRLFPILAPATFQQNIIFLSSDNVRNSVVGVLVTNARQEVRPVFNNLSLFGQDSWRLTNRMTVTYGVRWEFNPPPHETTGNEALTLSGTDNPATLALAPRGTPLYKKSYGNFAPRFGLAYQLSQVKGRETVLRGGVGIFYDLGNNEIGNAYSSFPFSAIRVDVDVPFPLAPSLQAAPPLPTSFNPPFTSAFNVYPSDFKLPYTFDANLAIEQAVGASQSITATYVAALGRRLLRREELTAPNPNFVSSVNIFRNDASSDYHALQLQFNRRLSRGLQAIASYTWAHSIDEVSDGIFSFTAARGNSSFDIRHVFSGAVTYNVPSPSARNLLTAVLRDWSIDSIVRLQSAAPVDLVAQTFTTIDGAIQNTRPDIIAGVPLYLSDSTAPGGRIFNKAAFAIPPIGRQGTLARNAMRGFPLSQVDFAVRRKFAFNERLNLQLRMEAFNLFNHPNFGTPNESLTSGLFGRATSMLSRSLGGLNPLYQIGGPRSIQMALKLQF